MNETAKQAGAVAERLQQSHNFSFDPTIIISVITLAMNFLKKCFAPDEGKTVQSEIQEGYNATTDRYNDDMFGGVRLAARRALRKKDIKPTRERVNELSRAMLDEGREGDGDGVGAAWSEPVADAA